MKKVKLFNEFLLGIDYGNSKIGIALGKAGVVAPIKVISAKNTRVAVDQIMRVAIENKISKFIVGLPLGADGKETKKSIEIRRFAKILKMWTKKPVDFQNEYATTNEANVEMIDMEIAQKKRRIDDHYSAALILKRYYNSLQ